MKYKILAFVIALASFTICSTSSAVQTQNEASIEPTKQMSEAKYKNDSIAEIVNTQRIHFVVL